MLTISLLGAILGLHSPLLAVGAAPKQVPPAKEARPEAAMGKRRRFEVSTKKADDRVKVETPKGRVVLSVTSPSGIGSATIRPVAGTWPGDVVLRLRLRGLESLTVSDGKVTLAGSASHDGGRLFLKDGDREKNLDKGDPYWTEIRVSGTGAGQFELMLPAALLKDSDKALTVSWIDFYRG